MLIAALFSCEAPHTNPLDPDNPENDFSAIKGIVLTETIPREPIQGVDVAWPNDHIVVQTNENGEFSLNKLSRKNGILIFSKDGFLPDTQSVTWGNDNIKSIDKFLNSIPKIETLNIYSSVINKPLNPQTVSMYVEAKLVDEEGDVDTVFVENKNLKISAKLEEISRGFYTKKFAANNLGLTSLEELIGKELEIVVKDKNRNKFTVAKSNLKRIISQVVQVRSPIDKQDSVSVTPNLQWSKFSGKFRFTYHVQVFTDEVIQQLIWEKTEIPADSIQVKVDVPISGNPANEYYWVISAVDEFKNRTQSNPASFKVLP